MTIETRQSLPILRTSERTLFKRCPFAWDLRYNQNLTPRGPPNKNLWFGTGIHLALAKWYLKGFPRGAPPWETWALFHKDEIRKIRNYSENQSDLEKYVDAGVLGDAMLRAYVDLYGQDEQWHFIATEFAAVVVIPGSCRYHFTWDGVVRDLETGEIYLVEHKTCANISVDHLPLDDQAGSYWALAHTILRKNGVLKEGQKISGIIYNFLRKAMPDTRPVNSKGQALNRPTKMHYQSALKNAGYPDSLWATMSVSDMEKAIKNKGIVVEGDVSKTQPAPSFHREVVLRRPSERKTQIERIKKEACVMKQMREGFLPIYKTPRASGYDSCAGGCEFYRLCLLHESGADWETYKDRMFKKGDPYDDYRKSALIDG